MQAIDLKAAKEHVMANYPNDPLLRQIALSLLDQLPKVDTVEVVRCKECRHRHTKYGCQGRSLEWYCPNGERMSEKVC